MEYKIKRSLTGSQSIHLTCPICKEPVVFDLNDAGTASPCPVCAVSIRVPGEAEKNTEAERKRGVMADARRREDAKRAEAQAQQVARDSARRALNTELPATGAKARYQHSVESKRVAEMTGIELRSVIAAGVLRGGVGLVALLILFAIVIGVWSAKLR
ncbi:MAG: hypothetical protein KF864_04960 [Phycisphaeraceae bacterium]|nr:hypothetical protein [Phycisphaeraceae bacterium]